MAKTEAEVNEILDAAEQVAWVGSIGTVTRMAGLSKDVVEGMHAAFNVGFNAGLVYAHKNKALFEEITNGK